MLTLDRNKRESLDSSQTAHTTQTSQNPNHAHDKAHRALVRFYLNLYREHMNRLNRYILRDDYEAKVIVENTANGIVRIWRKIDSLGGVL